MPLKPVSARALTTGYLIALLIIASLSIATHLVLETGLQSNEGSAAVINKAGRQRMLSQRIASLAAQYARGDASVRADLTSATNEFEAAHDLLILASQSNDEGAKALRAIYFASRNSLDGQIRGFLVDIRKFMDYPAGDVAGAPILSRILAEARAPLLNGLNDVVSVEQHESEQRITRLEHLQWAILATVLATLIVEASLIFRPMIRQIVDYTAELLRLATTDPLTGAANRRSFVEKAEAELARARRHDHPTSILMLDVDHFKNINDTYGHEAGDKVLVAVGEALRQALRQIDIFGRLGGEEFAVLLVETSLPAAVIMAERIREWFAGMNVQYGERNIKFTVSIGCTCLTGEMASFEDGLRVADHLMYRAKQTGRNRVISDGAVA